MLSEPVPGRRRHFESWIEHSPPTLSAVPAESAFSKRQPPPTKKIEGGGGRRMLIRLDGRQGYGRTPTLADNRLDGPIAVNGGVERVDERGVPTENSMPHERPGCVERPVVLPLAVGDDRTYGHREASVDLAPRSRSWLGKRELLHPPLTSPRGQPPLFFFCRWTTDVTSSELCIDGYAPRWNHEVWQAGSLSPCAVLGSRVAGGHLPGSATDKAGDLSLGTATSCPTPRGTSPR